MDDMEKQTRYKIPDLHIDEQENIWDDEDLKAQVPCGTTV